MGRALILLVIYGIALLIGKIVGKFTNEATGNLVALGIMLIFAFLTGGIECLLFVIVGIAFFTWLGEKLN